jgi:transposase
VKTKVHFEQPAQEATLADYLHEVEHAQGRIERLERSIDDAIETIPEKMRAVVEGLQSLRGIAKISAVTIVAELGEISRFTKPRQLMGYSGAVSREHSSGERTCRGSITKTGNAHLRRVVVEAAWSYRHRPCISYTLAKRQKNASPEVKEIAWKAQHRLYRRYYRLMAKGKTKQKVVTAVARELLGFIWDIGVTVERAHISSKQNRAA